MCPDVPGAGGFQVQAGSECFRMKLYFVHVSRQTGKCTRATKLRFIVKVIDSWSGPALRWDWIPAHLASAGDGLGFNFRRSRWQQTLTSSFKSAVSAQHFKSFQRNNCRSPNFTFIVTTKTCFWPVTEGLL